MKKLLLSILMILLCACSINSTAKKTIEDYLNGYKYLSNEVLQDLDKVANEEKLTDEQKNNYKEALKRQYQSLNYEILKESYNGDDAIVTTKVEVYDLYQAQQQASEYLKKNLTKFNNEKGVYDNNLYLDYKINLMKTTNERVSYVIDFNLVRENGNWVLKEISSSDLEKIHGIYNYEYDKNSK